MGIGAGRLAAAVLDATLLALLFGALALAVGSAMGRRAAAIAVPAAAAVAAYVVNALGVLVPALGPLQKASPFHLYVAADPLHHGVSLGHDALLLGAALLVAAAAPFTLARRDLH
jgi:ABC-2 type transport system permease protein